MASIFPPPQPLPFLARLRPGLSLRNERYGLTPAVQSRPANGWNRRIAAKWIRPAAVASCPEADIEAIARTAALGG
jgi:hypothetical protein